MRQVALIIAAGLALALAVPATAESLRPSPCVTATAACAEWVPLGDGGGRSMIYRTYPLGRPDDHIRRALIIVHGALRNADHYFATATGSAFIAGALGDTLVIAPAFHSANGDCADKLAPHEVSWSCGSDSWRSGGHAASDPGLSSFDFVDTLLKRLADKRMFPNLRVIVVAGHSAGGQFVSRYEMSNRVHESLGAPVQYVVANPSSYAWPDGARALPVDDGAPEAARAAWKDEQPHTHFSFGPFDDAKAPGYDRWPYGLEGRKGGYTAGMSDDELKRQLTSRPTTYLLGQVDVLPLGGFDESPQGMAQGATRRARGEAFVKYISDTLGAKPRVLIVPECGHNDRCIFTTDVVLAVLFPPI